MKWFLAGLGFGVAMGVVLAPARGEESRRRLREGATRAWDDMSDEARRTLDEMRSSDWARQARDIANEARDRASDAANQVRSRASDAASNLRERAPASIKQAVDRVTSAANIGNGGSQPSGNQRGRSDSASDGGRARGSLLELLNEGSQDELIAVNGIGPVLALKIVQNRPYKQEDQPLEDNVIPPSAFEALREHVKRSA